jgi:hypothetical protein
MTTAFREQQSPRLPSNHCQHVERILAREAAWRQRRRRDRGLRWSFIVGVLVFAVTVYFIT